MNKFHFFAILGVFITLVGAFACPFSQSSDDLSFGLLFFQLGTFLATISVSFLNYLGISTCISSGNNLLFFSLRYLYHYEKNNFVQLIPVGLFAAVFVLGVILVVREVRCEYQGRLQKS